MPFQLNCKNVFITYPKCDVQPRELLAFLVGKCSPLYACVARELHEDGTPHLHALLCCEKPIRTKSESFFNYQTFHPNIQAAKNRTATRRYIQKDGNFLEHGDWPEVSSSGPSSSVSEDDVRAKLQLPLVDFLIWASVNRVQYAERMWVLSNQPDVNTITAETPVSGTLSNEFYKILEQCNWDDDKSLVLVGSSGIGKTTWAKRVVQHNDMVPCLFVTHTDTLKEFRAGYHKSIIFDDVTFTHMPITTQIAIVDMENPRQIHCRHRKADIPAGVFKIFTCNDPPLDLEHPAIARRTTVIRCGPSELKKVTDVRQHLL